MSSLVEPFRFSCVPVEFGLLSISHTESGTAPPVICPAIPVEGSGSKGLPNNFEDLGIHG